MDEKNERTIQNGKTTIKVKWSTYKGRRGLDIRKYFVSKGTGELVPSQKGIWIPEAVAEETIRAAQSLFTEGESGK